MKKILLVPAALLMSLLSFGQTTGTEPVNKPQTMEQLAKSDPSAYTAVLNYSREHGSAIMDFPKGKEATVTATITMEKAALVDPAKMGLSIPSANQYFKIEGTNKLLLVKSVYVLQQEMKAPTTK